MKSSECLEQVLHYLNTAERKKLIIDSDTFNEVDDQFAVAYGLLAQDIDVLAINAAPFVSSSAPDPAIGMEQSYEEIQRVVRCVDPGNKHHVRTCRGSRSYLPNLVTPVPSEAAETIIELAHQATEPLFVACIGCFTNVASAILMDPSIIDKIVVILLGGNTFEIGHANDYNLKQDIPAARVLFECGVRLVIAPAHGCTEFLRTSTAELEFYLHGHAGEIGEFLIDRYFRDEGTPVREDGSCNSSTRPIWDIAAIALMRKPAAYCVAKILPAYTVDGEGLWREVRDGRSMIYIESFYRDAVFSDLFTVLRHSEGRMI